MSLPRRIVAGTTYLVTHRCLERRHFLRPSGETNALFEFVLGVEAERHGVLIHGYCLLSNHYHLVVTDVRGRLPDFQRDLGSKLARGTNRSLGRWETFWAPGSYSAVRLTTPGAIVEKVAYTLANPVLAGLVRHGAEWPGPRGAPNAAGFEGTLVQRPAGFFRAEGPMPRSTMLRLSRPPGFESDEAFAVEVEDAVRAMEARAAREIDEKGGAFLGAEGALAQYPFARPRTREPRRILSPTVAGREKWTRIESILQLKEFRRAYREAFRRWTSGAREVLFPHGTWLMRVRHAACCAPG